MLLEALNYTDFKNKLREYFLAFQLLRNIVIISYYVVTRFLHKIVAVYNITTFLLMINDSWTMIKI